MLILSHVGLLHGGLKPQNLEDMLFEAEINLILYWHTLGFMAKLVLPSCISMSPFHCGRFLLLFTKLSILPCNLRPLMFTLRSSLILFRNGWVSPMEIPLTVGYALPLLISLLIIKGLSWEPGSFSSSQLPLGSPFQ